MNGGAGDSDYPFDSGRKKKKKRAAGLPTPVKVRKTGERVGYGYFRSLDTSSRLSMVGMQWSLLSMLDIFWVRNFER